LVGKAYAGNGAGLKNYGIELKKTITLTKTKLKEQRDGTVIEEKSNSTVTKTIKGLEAVALIQAKNAGVAEQYAKTFSGQFDIVRDSINETVEAIGMAIGGGEGLPTFTRLLEGIRPVLDDVLGEINKNLPNIQEFSRQLVEKFLAKLPGYVATAKRDLPILIQKAKDFIGSVAGFAKDIGSFLGPDGLITAGIAGVGFKMGGLAGGIGAIFAEQFIKMGIDPITATLTGTIGGAITAGVVQGFGSAVAQAAVSKFLGLFKSVPITPSIPAGGGVPAAGGAATAASGVGSAAVAGVVAVAGAAAAAAAIVGIAAIAYSSIVPKDVQASISRRLGEFGKKAGEAGTATGAGGTYNAGGMSTSPTSDYLQIRDVKFNLGRNAQNELAYSVNRSLGGTFRASGPNRTSGR
jgi:hypothetical protein